MMPEATALSRKSNHNLPAIICRMPPCHLGEVLPEARRAFRAYFVSRARVGVNHAHVTQRDPRDRVPTSVFLRTKMIRYPCLRDCDFAAKFTPIHPPPPKCIAKHIHSQRLPHLELRILTKPCRLVYTLNHQRRTCVFSNDGGSKLGGRPERGGQRWCEGRAHWQPPDPPTTLQVHTKANCVLHAHAPRASHQATVVLSEMCVIERECLNIRSVPVK
jgi:hypothetical protein